MTNAASTTGGQGGERNEGGPSAGGKPSAGGGPSTGGRLAEAGAVREAEAGEATIVHSSKPRAPVATATPAAIADAVSGNTEFAFDLYRELRTTGDNLAFSPFSLSMAMAMVWAGSAGQTETDIATALHFTRPQSEVHAAFNALDQALERTSAGGFSLHIANSIWANPGIAPQMPYLDVLALYYGTGLELVNLMVGSVAAPAINGWVSSETQGHITNVVSPTDFDDKTLLALVNAIYLSGQWTTPFEPSRTHTADFNGVDGGAARVPTMTGTVWTGYAQGADFEAAELPYAGGSTDAAMLVILPTPGALDAFERSLDEAKLAAVVGALQKHVVDVELPRFDIASVPNIRSAFEALGLAGLFTAADFAPMMTPPPKRIQKLAHSAAVAIDEQGTDAFAATAVVLGGDGAAAAEAAVPPPAIFHVDRPFIFVIRDRATGSVLFLGRVVDPSKA